MAKATKKRASSLRVVSYLLQISGVIFDHKKSALVVASWSDFGKLFLATAKTDLSDQLYTPLAVGATVIETDVFRSLHTNWLIVNGWPPNTKILLEIGDSHFVKEK